MQVGILGGTFDPIHNGHLMIAQNASERFGLDRVMLLPSGDPPHKTREIMKEDRFEMVRRAAAAYEDEGFFACDVEIRREGTTYTVDTLRALTENDSSVEWYYIIGSDTLDVLESWRSFDEVAKLCIFIACGRAESAASIDKARYLKEKYGARILLSDYSGPDISSTNIRELVNCGRSIYGLVPEGVESYILEKGLYLSSMSEAVIIDKLRGMIKPSRFEHTMGVVETAVRLADRFDVPTAHARLAALLHDCAKSMPVDEMRSLVRENFPDADEQELESESVLHAPCGAYLARTCFGVNNPDILRAIRRHTLGDTGMSALDALIYVSDFIEPGRPAFKGMQEVRAAAETDIFEAAYLCAFYTQDYLKRKGHRSHPRSDRMMQELQSR